MNGTSPATVLVVSREARDGATVAAVLGEARVVTTASSADALEILRHGVDLVIVDGDLDLVRAIRDGGLCEQILLLCDDRRAGFEAGATDFLQRPIEPHELRCRARTSLALSAARRTLRAKEGEYERTQKGRVELARMVVHDLQNPLSALRANLSYIESRLESSGVADPLLEDSLQDARDSSSRVVALVHRLVDVERAEAGTLEVKKRRLRIRDLLTEVARRHRSAADERGQRIEVDADDTFVEADPELVARVVENLVGNAIRYARSRIRISVARDGGFDRVLVSNDGEPIPAAARPRIFEKYASTEHGPSSSHLGLGLYFCRLVLEAHGGSISLASSCEWPTVFALRLPRAAVARSPQCRVQTMETAYAEAE